MGGNWTEINGSAEFPERYMHSSAVFENKIWIIGGTGATTFNDTWYSSDGNIWRTANTSAEFPARLSHTSVVFDNKMWVIGGTNGATIFNDTWYSSDGRLWLPANLSAEFPARTSHTSVVFDNKMWVIGGTNGATTFNDTWFSTDGVIWTQTAKNALFPARYSHTSLVYDNKMWIIGGTNGATTFNDTWYSSDGVTWTRATEKAQFPAIYVHSSAVYDNKMWVIGGLDDGGRVLNDIWYSTDGASWTKTNPVYPPPKREGHTSEVFKSKMWILGGFDGAQNKNDTWSSINPPVADFTANPVTGTVSLGVAFNDTSTELPSSYSWQFGDGAVSTNKNPVHTYTLSGRYTVSLTVSNIEGSDTKIKTDYIIVNPVQNPGDSDSGGGSSQTQQPVIYSIMTKTVNVGGDSEVNKVTATGTGLSGLIITGIVLRSSRRDIHPPPGILYQYIDLIPAQYKTITDIKINFTVSESWLYKHQSDFRPKNIIMYHYNGTGWESLPTHFIILKNGIANFMAEGRGFSLFAITLNPDSILNTSDSPGIIMPESETKPDAVETLPINPEEEATVIPLRNILLIEAVIIAILAFTVIAIKRWIRRKTKDNF